MAALYHHLARVNGRGSAGKCPASMSAKTPASHGAVCRVAAGATPAPTDLTDGRANLPIGGLHPCPFCGAAASIHRMDALYCAVGCTTVRRSPDGRFRGYCPGQPQVLSFVTEADASVAWNARVAAEVGS